MILVLLAFPEIEPIPVHGRNFEQVFHYERCISIIFCLPMPGQAADLLTLVQPFWLQAGGGESVLIGQVQI